MAKVIKRSKRYQKRAQSVDRQRLYSLEEAIKALKGIKDHKFDESVTLDFQLGVRSGQSDEVVRGVVNLPHGSGKTKRVLCFAKGESAREAEAAGADYVGAEELVQKVQGGWLDFDAVVAHPDMMREVSKLGRILGPKGLMPTPKTGTVVPQVGRAVKELKAGRIEFRSDKTGGLHTICGKLSFSNEALLENARGIIRAIREAKPPASKGEFLKRVTIAVTQGPGFRLALDKL
ncbi:MAG: 50S ribosomal protein L1 [Candidatus Omnitrophica bacterium]|nr:50S ribosomal protein L1 [Candidatus Omnitrophota bacterium]